MNQDTIGEATAKPEGTAMRWLSEGIEELVRDCDRADKATQAEPDFDVVIIGSGYGGALAAAELAGGIEGATGRATRVCVLERGREYLAGMFPSSEADLPGSVTFNAPNSSDPYAATDGVLDFRLGDDVNVLLASGLGGGSLINAGVMAVPEPWVLQQPCWPEALRQPGALDRWFDEARMRLAPGQGQFHHPKPVKKQAALFRLHPKDAAFRAENKLGPPTPVHSSIAADATVNAAGVPLNACLQCGDCMTGCNHQAKNSLDQNLLVKAKRAGARIICGATVVRLARATVASQSAPWLLEIVATDPLLRRRKKKPFLLSARRVVLAAGTLGSTEILLRSQSDALKFSSLLGQRFSANGDCIAVSYGEREEVNAVADAFQPPNTRQVGPTITGMMKVGEGEDQIMVEELAIPAPFRRLFEEGFTTSHLFHRLGSRLAEWLHRPRRRGTDPYAVQGGKIARTQALGVIGHDGARGQLKLSDVRSRRRNPRASHQAIAVFWPELGERNSIFDRQLEKLDRLIVASRSGGTLLPNPFWQLLPKGMTQLLDMPRGPAFTTHPLGGCAMGQTWHEGVVDEWGRVFDPATPAGVHDGLVVLDGAIIPRSLGTNPAFTISALVLRALNFLKLEWQTNSAQELAGAEPPMPVYKTPQRVNDVPTQVAIRERLEGELHLANPRKPDEPLTLELTLRFQPVSVRDLATRLDRTLTVDPDRKVSFLRVFESRQLQRLRDEGRTEFQCDRFAVAHTEISGTMRLLDRDWSWLPLRIAGGVYAWFHNRGKRDTWGWLANLGRKKQEGGGRFLSGLLRAASYAGEIRLFEYDLVVGDSVASALPRLAAPKMHLPKGTRLRGTKRLTYERRSNPWTQMLEVTLTEISPPGLLAPGAGWFPQLAREPSTVLKLEPKFYARESKHLFEITQQRDGATAMFEMFSFLLHIFRLVAAVHLWSFRKPDPSSTETPQRLPGALPGVRQPVVRDIPVEPDQEPAHGEYAKTRGLAVNIRLTRYRKDGAGQPVLLIHGYSASGTTFAHPALQPGLAQYLYDAGRDVWVIDLRTSAGLPTAKHPWSFEQVADEDIPTAFKHILQETGVDKIDVVAHCMGAAMFSMALLGKPGHRICDVATHVRSVVFSQVGPRVVFTAANIFRAYAVSYIQQVFRESNFEFRPSPGIGGAFLDRLLATVPYPREEFDFEHPPEPWAQTPFVASRHRMDAWFGQAFSVANMDPLVLEHIDDFFGGINLQTLFQTIHFARNSMVTTRRGGNAFLLPERLERLQAISFFSLHGQKNGLADPATLVRMEEVMVQMKIPFQAALLKDYGHQDCIMGRRAAAEVFPMIRRFLDAPKDFAAPPATVMPRTSLQAEPEASAAARSGDAHRCVAHLPFMGPLIGIKDATQRFAVAFAADPKVPPPSTVLLISAAVLDETWRTALLERLVKPGAAGLWESLDLETRELHDSDVLPQMRRTSPQTSAQDSPRWYRISQPTRTGLAPQAAILVLISHGPRNHSRGPYLNHSASNWTTTDIYTALGANEKRIGLSAFPPPPGTRRNETIDIFELVRQQAGMVEALRDLLLSASLDELQQAQFLPPALQNHGSTTLRFALASCQYPAGPLDPTVAELSYTRLARRLDTDALRPRCAVLMGDQIYADATAGLFDPSQMDDRFELPYQAWLRTPIVRHVLRRLPMYAIFDDHEIDNNWECDDLDQKTTQLRINGLAAYFRVQRATDPNVTPENRAGSGPAWFETKIDGFDFFFVDGRSERRKRDVTNLTTAMMIEEVQMQSLLAWLDRPDTGRPRFIASASILLPRRKLTSAGPAGAINSDAWDGYPATFRRLLAHIANRGIANLVFLSGDEHHSCIATARLSLLDEQRKALKEPTVLHSIHSSALYAPFPFANGEPANLAGEECFRFPNPERSAQHPAASIGCEVRTHFVTTPGDGFAMLDCQTVSGNDWELRCEFSRPSGSENYQLTQRTCARLRP